MKNLTVPILIFLAIPLWAQPANLRVVKTAPRQIVVAYTAPDAAACSVEASEESDYAPLVHDVNGTMFPGQNSDLSRADTVVRGRERIVTIGPRDNGMFSSSPTSLLPASVISRRTSARRP